MSATTPIHVSKVHMAIQLSVPYDLNQILHSFYTFYASLPVEGDNTWGQDYTSQERFMTLEQVFKCLSSFTLNIPERDAIRARMIGHITSHAGIPYDEVEACANINFK